MYGLLGAKLGHSFSKRIHERFGLYNYELIEVSEAELDALLRAKAFDGLNVTIPYKRTVMPYCDELMENAQTIGSVNTLINRNGRIIGENTDCYGFAYMARSAGIAFEGMKVIVLGSGGTSLMAQAAARNGRAREVVCISRSGPDNYENLYRHYDADIIVNATPVGMYPDNARSVIALEPFLSCKGVIDVVYNPLHTRLLLEARRLNIPHTGGLIMLVAQAKRAAELFTGIMIDDALIDTVTAELCASLTNIVITGMPGSGKSTLAHMLGEKLVREVLEMDALIEAQAGMSIPELFAQRGEAGFRALEREVAAQAGRRTGVIISTGGGALLDGENYKNLKQNGNIVLLERDLSRLEMCGRPLSKSLPDLERMYRERKPVYEACADFRADNNGSVQTTLENVLKKIYSCIKIEYTE
jgi:shikimate dehydrogenase